MLIFITNCFKKDVQTLNNGIVLDYQEKFVRKIVNFLNEFDNITYEIQNEPWSDHSVSIKTTLWKSDSTIKDANDWRNKVEIADQASLDWQKKIGSFIVDEENHLPKKHHYRPELCQPLLCCSRGGSERIHTELPLQFS